MKRGSALVTLLAALALPLAVPAIAEQHEEEAGPPKPIIWVSFLKTPAGGSQNLIRYLTTENSELYGPLMADGALYEWGVAQPITHRGNDPYNVVEWATFAGWEGVDAFVAAFMARMESQSPEEMAARQEAYMSAVVPGSHADVVLLGEHVSTGGDRPGYIVIGYHKAHAGKEARVTEQWKTHAQPKLTQILADGAIQGFGLFTQALHTDSSWTHGSWSTMAGLVGMDAVSNAFATMDPQVLAEFMGMVEWEAHRDEVLAVVHYENAQSQQ